MTASFNPMFYLKHAWERTNSVWGKTAIVLFYTFVWFQIIWAIQVLVAPFAGFGCTTGQLTEEESLWMGSLVRQLNVFTIGFFLYADRGGIKAWNVAMVFVVYVAGSSLYISMASTMMESKNLKECSDELSKGVTLLWTTMVWSALSLAAAIADERIGNGGTAGETTPLVV